MAKEDYEGMAQDIIKNVGGKDNVDKVIHCITRLRFYLNDETKANTEEMSKVPGIAGAVYNSALGQYQVVIGPAVADVYDKVVEHLGSSVVDNEATNAAVEATKAKEQKPKNVLDWFKGAFQTLIGTITGSMIPVIGLLAAGGMLNGFLTLLSDPNLLGLISTKSDTFTIIQSMAMAPF